MISTFPHESPARRFALVLLTWTWCLPTTLVGLLAGLFTQLFLAGSPEPFRGSTVVRSPRLRNLGGVCLGPVILVTDRADQELVCHEWGHFRQHLLLGPLYLLVIGIPSVTHAAWHRMTHGGFPAYYHFWTEAWADHLGGVYPRHAHRHTHWTGYAFAPALVATVGLLTLRSFGHALAFPFTDADALADVAWAGRPLSDQLLVPLTGGLGGDNANFWRPAAMIQFWVLRHLFGEAPAGWHAWDLTLHALASGLVGVLVLRLTQALRRPDPALALVTAGLFAAHPLAEEIVPAVARNIDLLLAVAFFGALLALVSAITARRQHQPSAGHELRFFALSALALFAKEAGVLLLPVGAAWVFLLRDDLPASRRIRECARLLAPFASLLLPWYDLRNHVLGGVGGYRDAETLGDGGLLGAALSRGFLEPLAPSISGTLAPLQGTPGVVLTWLVWGALLYGLRRHAHLLLAAAALYVPWILLLGVTGTYSRRVLYVPTFAIALVLALALVEMVRAALREGDRPATNRPRALLSLGATIGTLLLFATWVHGSPAFVRYVDWEASGRTSTPLLDPAVWERFPDGATVLLVDRPARVDLDPRRYRLWSKRKSLANAATTYSLEAWVDEHVPRDLRLRTLTSILPEGDPSRFRAEVSVEGATVVVRRPEWRRSPPDKAQSHRTVTERVGVKVDDARDALSLSAAADAEVWALVWDPQTPLAARIFPGGAQVWATR